VNEAWTPELPFDLLVFRVIFYARRVHAV